MYIQLLINDFKLELYLQGRQFFSEGEKKMTLISLDFKN